jgi:fido (protein-threonine AMPylation protein)
MAYIHRKAIKGRDYYYLRASQRKGGKLVTKDLAYLGSTLADARHALAKHPEQEVRTAAKTLNRLLTSSHWLEKARQAKPRHTPYLDRPLLEQLEACRLHWQEEYPKHDTRKDCMRRFAIEFAHHTTAIEGNTITLKEAYRLLRDQRTPQDKTIRELHDLQNTERVFLAIAEQPPEPGHEVIVGIHRELMKGIDARTGYRTRDIHVISARFESAPAQYVETDMGLLIRWYREHEHQLHPLVLAAIVHHQFEKIHPFFDGNGRTGRMLLNAILLRACHPPLIIQNRSRPGYLDALAAADKTGLAAPSPAHYQELVNFLAVELINSYWNSFL